MAQDIAHYVLHGQNVGDRPARPGIGEPLTRREKAVERNKHTMSTNTEILRKIVAEFPNLQHEKKTLEGNHEMTFREAIRALYPTLRDMKKRGFTAKEIAQKLNESGVAIRPTTLSKYLNEIEMEQLIKSASMRRRNDIRQSKKASPQHDIPVNTNDTPTTSESE